MNDPESPGSQKSQLIYPDTSIFQSTSIHAIPIRDFLFVSVAHKASPWKAVRHWKELESTATVMKA